MLVERDSFLASLLEWVPDADTPSGCLVLLGGEAGVGKTSLVGLLTSRVGAEVAVRRGFCDNVAPPPPLGAVLDALPELAATIEETTPTTRPRLFREIRTRLVERPTVLVLEDVHWADEATLELVRFLGRRLDGMPLLVVATFRDDDVGTGAPLTPCSATSPRCPTWTGCTCPRSVPALSRPWWPTRGPRSTRSPCTDGPAGTRSS
ncbi:MAG: ATP-binding protein [Lapillicoccus sp.]